MNLVRMLIVLSACASIVVGVASADDFVHDPTGVKLPDELLGFVRESVMDYEKDTPGQGMGFRYVKQGGYAATLYIYTAGLNPVPTSIDDAAILEQQKIAAEVLLQRAKTREPLAVSANSRQTIETIWDTPTEPKTRVLLNRFIVYIRGVATNDTLMIWLARGHIWKLRVTREGEIGDTYVPFATAVVQLSVAAQTPGENGLKPPVAMLEISPRCHRHEPRCQSSSG